jgi:hypothetical protein
MIRTQVTYRFVGGTTPSFQLSEKPPHFSVYHTFEWIEVALGDGRKLLRHYAGLAHFMGRKGRSSQAAQAQFAPGPSGINEHDLEKALRIAPSPSCGRTGMASLGT